ncbi:MAG TPA: AAA family ATPase [Motiliproteus sp.]
MDSTLLAQLQSPHLFDHPVTALEVIETHISWVLLTGPYAYKFRKPVDFGFLDFTTLGQRQQDCEEELRLNRRLAASLYVGLTRITQGPEGPEVDGDGEVLEYAVKMVQFGQEQLLSQLDAHNRLDSDCMQRLAQHLAAFHRDLPSAPSDSDWGSPTLLAQVIGDNFRTIRAQSGAAFESQLQPLQRWSQQCLDRLQPLLQRRRAEGWVRECHGDLHLGNIVNWQGQPLPFDCIEFNPRYRWIDTLNDLAFILMDLEFRQRHSLAHELLDHYLAASGDYTGAALLPLFKSYRALVRAKVALLGDNHERLVLAQRYITLASSYTQTNQPCLTLMYGVSGSGKSYRSSQLVRTSNAVRLRSDIERKRLFPQPEGRYHPSASLRTYAHLLEQTEELLQQGIAVIVDAAFLREAQRRPFFEVAARLQLPIQLIECSAPTATLIERVQARAAAGGDPSEATVAVLQEQLATREPLTPAERAQLK